MRGRTPTTVATHHIAVPTAEERTRHPWCFGNDGQPAVYVTTTRYAGRPLRRFVCAQHGRTFAARHNLTLPTPKENRATR